MNNLEQRVRTLAKRARILPPPPPEASSTERSVNPADIQTLAHSINREEMSTNPPNW